MGEGELTPVHLNLLLIIVNMAADIQEGFFVLSRQKY
jgi:hypothetical protein